MGGLEHSLLGKFMPRAWKEIMHRPGVPHQGCLVEFPQNSFPVYDTVRGRFDPASASASCVAPYLEWERRRMNE